MLSFVLLVLVLLFAFFIAHLTSGTSTPTVSKPATNVIPNTTGPNSAMTTGSGLTPQQIDTLNINFHGAGCTHFDAVALQAALNQIPAGKLVFNLANLAGYSPVKISEFVIKNKDRFPFFKSYCNGDISAVEFVHALKRWALNPFKH